MWLMIGWNIFLNAQAEKSIIKLKEQEDKMFQLMHRFRFFPPSSTPVFAAAPFGKVNIFEIKTDYRSFGVFNLFVKIKKFYFFLQKIASICFWLCLSFCIIRELCWLVKIPTFCCLILCDFVCYILLHILHSYLSSLQ